MNQDMKQLKEEIFRDKEIREFCERYNISDKEWLEHFEKFVIQKENNSVCRNCEGSPCWMDPFGYRTRLVYTDRPEIEYYECPIAEHEYKNRISLLYFPKNVSFENQKLDLNSERANAVKLMMTFKNSYEKGRFLKGIYFHGPFGTGKTFLMYQLAKDLAKKNIDVIMAYYPDLVRYIKSSIGSNDLEKTVNELKYAEVLMLDDIGAENNTGFIRDEVLGPILQFRLESNLPVCFTSNLSLKLLKEHYMESKDEINQIKSDRIIERIRTLTTQVEVRGENYRIKATI